MLEKWDSLMEKRERLKEMMLEDEDLQNAVELKANEVCARLPIACYIGSSSRSRVIKGS